MRHNTYNYFEKLRRVSQQDSCGRDCQCFGAPTILHKSVPNVSAISLQIHH